MHLVIIVFNYSPPIFNWLDMIFGRTMNDGNGATSSTSNNLHDPMTPTNKYVRERRGERTREKVNGERE